MGGGVGERDTTCQEKKGELYRLRGPLPFHYMSGSGYTRWERKTAKKDDVYDTVLAEGKGREEKRKRKKRWTTRRKGESGIYLRRDREREYPWNRFREEVKGVDDLLYATMLMAVIQRVRRMEGSASLLLSLRNVKGEITKVASLFLVLVALTSWRRYRTAGIQTTIGKFLFVCGLQDLDRPQQNIRSIKNLFKNLSKLLPHTSAPRLTWNEHISVSSTLIIAPALSNSPQ